MNIYIHFLSKILFYDKMNLKLFYFCVTILSHSQFLIIYNFCILKQFVNLCDINKGSNN